MIFLRLFSSVTDAGTVLVSSFFRERARRAVEGEEKSCRPPLSFFTCPCSLALYTIHLQLSLSPKKNQQTCGGRPVCIFVLGLLEKSQHDIARAREVHCRSKNMVRPRLATEVSGAVIGEGADQPTLRAQEDCVLRTFIDTMNVGDKRWGPPLVDARLGRPSARPSSKESKGSEWEAMYRYNDLHPAAKSKKSNEKQKNGKSAVVRERSQRQRGKLL